MMRYQEDDIDALGQLLGCVIAVAVSASVLLVLFLWVMT